MVDYQQKFPFSRSSFWASLFGLDLSEELPVFVGERSRLQQVWAAGPGSSEALFAPPASDGLVVAGNQHLGHLMTLGLGRARAMKWSRHLIYGACFASCPHCSCRTGILLIVSLVRKDVLLKTIDSETEGELLAFGSYDNPPGDKNFSLYGG